MTQPHSPSGPTPVRPEGHTPPPPNSHHAGRDPDEQAWRDVGLELDGSNRVTALVHLYRAEVGRANLWRNRLDTTTNWAVVTTAGALTFSFSSPENPHFLLLLVLMLVLTFLIIEARRYTYYALWYYRVRLLETGFFSTLVSTATASLPVWGEALSSSLQEPTFVISRWRAIANRYRRNYVWLISLIIISWILKLTLHPTPVSDLQIVISRACIGQSIPGGWAIGLVGGLYLALLTLLLAAYFIPIESATRRPQDRSRAEPRREQMAIIITTQKERISQEIMDKLHRGVTATEGVGMYTGQARSVLFSAVPRAAEAALQQIVEETDPEAFVILVGARDIRGRGFAPTEPPA